MVRRKTNNLEDGWIASRGKRQDCVTGGNVGNGFQSQDPSDLLTRIKIGIWTICGSFPGISIVQSLACGLMHASAMTTGVVQQKLPSSLIIFHIGTYIKQLVGQTSSSTC